MAGPYLWGWIAVAVGALGLVLGLLRASRGWHAPLLKALVGWSVLLLLAVPAQVPRHTEALAPAFVVFIFESLFQRDGSAGAAGRILAAAAALALVLGLASYFAGRLRGRRKATD